MTDIGRSPDGSSHSPKGEAASSTASPAKPSVPNARDALDMLITAVEFEACRIANEGTSDTIRACGRALLDCANEAKPSLIYPHQRAAMAIRDALGRSDEAWEGFVPAAFAALLAAPSMAATEIGPSGFDPERVATWITERDRKAIWNQLAALRNLSVSMRKDVAWRMSAVSVAEAAWTIEKLFETIEASDFGPAPVIPLSEHERAVAESETPRSNTHD